MIVDAHVHLGTWRSLDVLEQKIRTSADVMAWRTRHPELFRAIVEEEPVGNADELIADMDRFGIDQAVVMTEANIPNDLVGAMVAQHPDRLTALVGVGQSVSADGRPDPVEMRKRAVDEIERCVALYDVRGIGEMLVRNFTKALHPEEIADDFSTILEAARRHRLSIMIPTAWTQFRGGLYYGNPLYVDELAPAYPRCRSSSRRWAAPSASTSTWR